MKIIFDIDGTLTDYNEFVQKRAIPFFASKAIAVINPDGLEIEDIFGIERHWADQQIQTWKTEDKACVLLKEFWLKNFMYFFTQRFRRGVTFYIRKLKKEGHVFEVHTSCAQACKTGITGRIIRILTLIQFALNGLPLSRSNIFFYKKDLGVKSNYPISISHQI